MRNRRARGIVAGAVALVGALVLASCFGGNVSVSGKLASSLSPTNPSKRLEVSIKTSTSLGSPWGGMSGSLRDSGTNPAFPYGVKLNFNRGIATGLGEFCDEDPNAGPSRRVHALVRGGGGGGEGTNPCALALGEDPRLWVSLVTYSSADTRRYPNVFNPECGYAYSYLNALLISEAFGLLGGTTAPTRRSSTDLGGNITGFGLMFIVDSDANRNLDRGDRFAFAALCGPYANIPLPSAPGSNDPVTTYSYGTCVDPDAPNPGMVPGFLSGIGSIGGGEPGAWISYALSELTQPECLRALMYGDAKITPVFDWTSGVTGPGVPN